MGEHIFIQVGQQSGSLQELLRTSLKEDWLHNLHQNTVPRLECVDVIKNGYNIAW